MFILATILRLKVAKRPLFEKLILKRCSLVERKFYSSIYFVNFYLPTEGGPR